MCISLEVILLHINGAVLNVELADINDTPWVDYA